MDGQPVSWRALTEFEMVKAISTQGRCIRMSLAAKCREFGYEIEEKRDDKGQITGFEIVGVSREVCDRFSNAVPRSKMESRNFNSALGGLRPCLRSTPSLFDTPQPKVARAHDARVLVRSESAA